jgi:short subunit dehydrogenase-like uncharacterized protein
MADREYDVVLFGATGFTGGLTADYLAAHADAGTRWAIAGRNRQKLEDVRSRLGPQHADLPIEEADVDDPASIRRLAESSKVVITTVGPYLNYGEPVVAACAAAGTDYVDLTGEPEFVDLMWLGYHAEAERNGARLVHSCGFDAIPSDLGALFSVKQLPEGAPIALQGFMSSRASLSGGTYHSAINLFGRLRQASRVARERRSKELRPVTRQVRGIQGKVHDEPVAGGWVVPLPTIDPQTVLRSARALDRYGPDFSYTHYLVAKHLPLAAGVIGGAGAVIAMAQVPPARELLLKLKDPGEGPSPEQRARSWFRVRFLAQSDGRKTVTQVSGGDPGYTETSKMLSEAALCLVHDQLPDTSGQVTPAVAMGDALIERLTRAGISFEVVEP